MLSPRFQITKIFFHRLLARHRHLPVFNRILRRVTIRRIHLVVGNLRLILRAGLARTLANFLRIGITRPRQFHLIATRAADAIRRIDLFIVTLRVAATRRTIRIVARTISGFGSLRVAIALPLPRARTTLIALTLSLCLTLSCLTLSLSLRLSLSGLTLPLPRLISLLASLISLLRIPGLGDPLLTLRNLIRRLGCRLRLIDL